MKNFRHISKAVYIDITNTLTIVSLRYSALIFIRYSICNLILKKLNTIHYLVQKKIKFVKIYWQLLLLSKIPYINIKIELKIYNFSFWK